MSNRRPIPDHRAAITQQAAALDGAEIPGGCDTCDAHKTVQVVDHGLINVRVHHVDWCPELHRHQRATARTRRPDHDHISHP
jgi:hypothetical protein